jgi:hypothetical protein
MTDRYRASKPVAHWTGRAQCWSEPRRPEQEPEPGTQPQPKAGVEAGLKAAAVFLAGGIGMLTIILAAMYFAALLSAYAA